MPLSRLRIVVFPETLKTWTARSLEHDLAAGGRTPEDAIDMLVKIAEAHIAFDTRHGREPLSAFAAAPMLYWNAFDAADKTTNRTDRHAAGQSNTLRWVVGVVPQNPIVSRHLRRTRIA